MKTEVWVFSGKTEDCERHVLVFDHKPTKAFLKESFENAHSGMYTYDEVYEQSLTQHKPIANPKLKKIKDGPY